MKPYEKFKTQSVLDKILSGAFDVNDVESIFRNLREYCDGHHVVREVGNFLAHKSRDKGFTLEFIYGACLSHICDPRARCPF